MTLILGFGADKMPTTSDLQKSGNRNNDTTLIKPNTVCIPGLEKIRVQLICWLLQIFLSLHKNDILKSFRL